MLADPKSVSFLTKDTAILTEFGWMSAKTVYVRRPRLVSAHIHKGVYGRRLSPITQCHKLTAKTVRMMHTSNRNAVRLDGRLKISHKGIDFYNLITADFGDHASDLDKRLLRGGRTTVAVLNEPMDYYSFVTPDNSMIVAQRMVKVRSDIPIIKTRPGDGHAEGQEQETSVLQKRIQIKIEEEEFLNVFHGLYGDESDISTDVGIIGDRSVISLDTLLEKTDEDADEEEFSDDPLVDMLRRSIEFSPPLKGNEDDSRGDDLPVQHNWDYVHIKCKK